MGYLGSDNDIIRSAFIEAAIKHYLETPAGKKMLEEVLTLDTLGNAIKNKVGYILTSYPTDGIVTEQIRRLTQDPEFQQRVEAAVINHVTPLAITAAVKKALNVKITKFIKAEVDKALKPLLKAPGLKSEVASIYKKVLQAIT